MSLQGLRLRLREAYWLVPAALTGGALLLSVAMVEVDGHLQREGLALAFTGGPDSARSILSAIASSMLTLTALVFSITVIVLQLASTQFSPRVLRTFLGDRQNQITLGVFTGTFVYALAALRSVRGEDGVVDRFVPGLTITAAFVLVLVSVALFVAYIQHITQSIRVSTIIDHIAAETDREISRTDAAGADVASTRPPPHAAPTVLRAPRRGVVLSVDHDALVRRAGRDGGWIEVAVRVGDFVPEDAPLAVVHGPGADLEELAEAFVFGIERTIDGDVTFGFRQLVDIAARALSPGINDPTTATQCLDQLHHLLRRLVVQPTPVGQRRDGDGVLRVTHPVVSWEEFVALALDEIRNVGAGSLQIQSRVEALLRDLIEIAPDHRRPPLEEQLSQLLRRRTFEVATGERPDRAVGRRPNPEIERADDGGGER